MSFSFKLKCFLRNEAWCLADDARLFVNSVIAILDRLQYNTMSSRFKLKCFLQNVAWYLADNAHPFIVSVIAINVYLIINLSTAARLLSAIGTDVILNTFHRLLALMVKLTTSSAVLLDQSQATLNRQMIRG